MIGVILGGLGGGALGTEVGAIFGRVIDDRVLNNCRCVACGYTFSGQRGTSEPAFSPQPPMPSTPPGSPSGMGPDTTGFDDDHDPDLD